ncbi:probable palmitoyltransferase ZDHHC24 [Ischnura elegans]|uniref:probable palmitoyltransferase ZDHHC24 n=1 Tax=Ischnura elegans TaxID=197161 RepID=UPI001ED87A28|nr:probable palmitoyltransferase ZDHHC24 [Ischnura elegans]
MKIRKKCYPKTFMDLLSFSFIFLIIPVMYWFELFIVLPTVYTPWSLWHTFHFLCGTLVMINVTSNFMATFLCDTSLSKDNFAQQTSDSVYRGWHLCKSCDLPAPPRSWHCDICGCCILKREHHCPFTGCCIGHYNHRYYLMFILNLFIATMYATIFNNAFIWKHFTWGVIAIMKVLCPLAMLVYGFDASPSSFFVFLYIVNVAGMFISGSLLYIHGTILLRGIVTYEKRHNIMDYDYGVEQNIKELLGDKWFLVWIYPFAQSKLPRNGVSWPALESAVEGNRKDR